MYSGMCNQYDKYVMYIVTYTFFCTAIQRRGKNTPCLCREITTPPRHIMSQKVAFFLVLLFTMRSPAIRLRPHPRLQRSGSVVANIWVRGNICTLCKARCDVLGLFHYGRFPPLAAVESAIRPDSDAVIYVEVFP